MWSVCEVKVTLDRNSVIKPTTGWVKHVTCISYIHFWLLELSEILAQDGKAFYNFYQQTWHFYYLTTAYFFLTKTRIHNIGGILRNKEMLTIL